MPLRFMLPPPALLIARLQEDKKAAMRKADPDEGEESDPEDFGDRGQLAARDALAQVGAQGCLGSTTGEERPCMAARATAVGRAASAHADAPRQCNAVSLRHLD